MTENQTVFDLLFAYLLLSNKVMVLTYNKSIAIVQPHMVSGLNSVTQIKCYGPSI